MKSQRGSVVRTESVTPDLPLRTSLIPLVRGHLAVLRFFLAWRRRVLGRSPARRRADPCSGYPLEGLLGLPVDGLAEVLELLVLVRHAVGYPPAASS